MLEKYQSLSAQAEKENSYESYKELIDTIRGMTYEETFQLFYDAETALDVILREGLPNTHRGIWSCVKNIVEKGQLFLMMDKASYYEIQYTYEFTAKQKGKKIQSSTQSPIYTINTTDEKANK